MTSRHSRLEWRQAGFMRSGLMIALVVFAIGVVIVSCAVNKATGERHLNLIGESSEIAMGQQADSQVIASIGLYPDAALQRYIQELGAKLAKTSERPELPWTFRVVDDPAVNAFAIPGGFIYVTRGLLTYVENEAELAGVVGHEIGHVTAQHSVHSMSSQQVTQLGVAAGMMIKPELQKYGGALSTGLSLLYLKYSRDDESQADHLGFRYMVRAGDDPRQMIRVFDMLNRVSQAAGSGSVPTFLETHPNPENRSAAFQKEIDTLSQNLNSLSTEQDSYLTRIDGTVFGENPRDGFFRSNHFYHPELAFECEFPSGWKTVNQTQAVAAVSPGQDAVVQITTSPGASSDAAMRTFTGQQGMTSEPVKTVNVNGLRTASTIFHAQTDQGVVQGKVVYIEYNSRVFQFLGYTTESAWSQYQTAMVTAMGTFRKLTDQKILQVQPMKVKMITTAGATTLSQLATQYGSPVDLLTLSIINQTTENAAFVKGQRVKMVVGEKLSTE